MDFPVDCRLFLRITGCKLGKYSQYVIETSGVRAEMTLDSLDKFAMGYGGEQETPVLLDFIEGAKLAFPTTASCLLTWLEENNDFLVPEWVAAVVDAKSIEAAQEVLVRAHNIAKGELQALEKKYRGMEEAGEKPGVWYPIKIKAGEVNQRTQAIESIQIALREAGRRPASSREANLRSDTLRTEIVAILEAPGAIRSPAYVMKMLKESAGCAGSCIQSAEEDRVSWMAMDGSKKELTMRALEKRMSRLK